MWNSIRLIVQTRYALTENFKDLQDEYTKQRTPNTLIEHGNNLIHVNLDNNYPEIVRPKPAKKFISESIDDLCFLSVSEKYFEKVLDLNHWLDGNFTEIYNDICSRIACLE